MSTAREAAWKILERWTALENPPMVPERGGDEWKELSAQDRAFAFDLVTGVIRWRGLLDAVINSRLRDPKQPLNVPLRALLWLGAYQLLIQSGTSDYAAVDTAVTLARQNPATVRAGGLVNAVLRGVTRLNPVRSNVATKNAALRANAFALDFSTLVTFSESVFPEPLRHPTLHLAAVRSHPPELVRHFQNLFGNEQAAAILLRNNLRPLVTLRRDSASVPLPAELGLEPLAESPLYVVATRGWNTRLEQLVHTGALSPQDYTAGKPVIRAADLAAAGAIKTPATILDLCAGLGTKTMQLAKAFPNARIVAADIEPQKLHRLLARAKQIGLTNVDILLAGALEGRGLTFDLVLADVPCSNTGVMGKRVQSRWRWPTLDRSALAVLQTKLLQQAIALTAPGGAVIYATCSIDPAENGEMIRGGTKVGILEETTTLPSLSDHPNQTHDGGYFTVLTHSGNS